MSKYYKIVSPNNIKLVADNHPCNPNPNYNSAGQYVGDFVHSPSWSDRAIEFLRQDERSEGREWYYIDGPLEYDSGKRYYGNRGYNDNSLRMPKPDFRMYKGPDNEKQFRLYESNAIGKIFGAPDDDKRVVPDENTVFDAGGGYETYNPGALVHSANGISISSYLNGGSYVEAWGDKNYIGQTAVPKLSDPAIDPTEYGEIRYGYVSNNKYIYGKATGIPRSVNTRANPLGHQTLPEEHEHMAGMNGISFGQFTHSTPTVPEITEPFPAENSTWDQNWNTYSTRRRPDNVSTGRMWDNYVTIKYIAPTNANNRRWSPTKTMETEDPRYINVQLWSWNNSNYLDFGQSPYFSGESRQWSGERTNTSIGAVQHNGLTGPGYDNSSAGSGAGGAGREYTDQTLRGEHKIRWDNFDMDDVTCQIRTLPGPRTWCFSNGDISKAAFIDYRFFDALEGEWSLWDRKVVHNENPAATSIYGNTAYRYMAMTDDNWRDEHWLPFGFFCPQLAANDGIRADDNISSVTGQTFKNTSFPTVAGREFAQNYGLYKDGYSASGPGNFGTARQTAAGRARISRTYMITRLEVRVGVMAYQNATPRTSSNYASLGGGNNNDDFIQSDIRFSFPYIPTKSVWGEGSDQGYPGSPNTNITDRRFEDLPADDRAVDRFVNVTNDNYMFSDEWLEYTYNNNFPEYLWHTGKNTASVDELYRNKYERGKLSPSAAQNLAAGEGTWPIDEGATVGYAYPIGTQTLSSHKIGRGLKLETKWS